MTYIEYVCEAINNKDSRVPIYTKQIAETAAKIVHSSHAMSSTKSETNAETSAPHANHMVARP